MPHMTDEGGAVVRVVVKMPAGLKADVDAIALAELTPTAVLIRRWINERVSQRKRDERGARDR